MTSRKLALVLAAGVAALTMSCTTTRLETAWTNPALASQRIVGPVLVVGVARDETVRRLYEDEMTARLAARGVQARPSYALVPGPLDKDGDARLLEAARAAGVKYLLSTAIIATSKEQVVAQEPAALGFGMGGYRRWYGGYWGVTVPLRTEVRSYEVLHAQTALTDVAAERIDWTARTRTAAPTDLERETRAFAGVVLDALAQSGLVAPGK